jgi:phosphoribosyl-dephospho-CoA transferase
MTILRRHALVRFSQAPEADNETDRPLVERWHGAGRPFVICRHRGTGDDVSLGFCAAQGKFPEIRPRRVAAHAAARHIIHMERPPALEDVARCAAAADHAQAFARLGNGAARAGLDVRVYGSWMWQTLTSEGHVRPSSDLDLLVEVAGRREADRAAIFLEHQEAELPFKLDGELVFPDLGEVQWREFRLDTPEVLLKAMDTVRMIRRDSFRP